MTVGGATTEDVSYGYDDNDRLTQEQDAATSHTTNYYWNDDGDLTEKDGPDGQTTYDWDAEDRLVSANVPGHALSFTYDAEGIRQSTTLDGATTSFLVDGNRPYAQVLEEHGPSRNLRWVLGERRLAELQQSVSGTQQHWLITDSLATVRGLADVGATSLSDTYDYEAFGSPLSATGSTPNDFRFTGEQWQPELGMEYLRARWMQPGIGRFVSADGDFGEPIWPSSTNRYAWALDEPTQWCDPSGWSVFDMMRGTKVHEYIGKDFERKVYGGYSNRAIKTILGIPVRKKLAYFRPDLADSTRRMYFEIKAVEGLPEGLQDVAFYGMMLNLLDSKPGKRWTPGWPSDYSPPPFFSIDDYVVFAFPPVGGVITYKTLGKPEAETAVAAAMYYVVCVIYSELTQDVAVGGLMEAMGAP